MPISYFRFKRESGSRDAATAAFALPRRALIALGLGFACVATALATLDPTANSVLAAPEDSAASYWLSERRQSAPSAQAIRRQQAQQRHAQQQQARLQEQARLQQQASWQQQQMQLRRQHQLRQAQQQARYNHQQQIHAQMQQAPRRSELSQFIDRMPWNRVVTITPRAFDLPRTPKVAPVIAPTSQQPRISSPAVDVDARPAAQKTAAVSVAPRSKIKPKPRALCVRLCDGSFFPVPGTGAGTQEDCNLACPRAPTRLYKTTNGDISTAVSAATGASYFTLPVAMRFSKAVDQTCSCGKSYPMATILRDATLRRGDRVMTADGFRVFKGGASPPYSPRNFDSIDKALNLPRSERAILRSMERATGVRPGAGRRDAFAALSQPDIQTGRSVSQ